MASSPMLGFFDISTPEVFFSVIRRAIKELDGSQFKSAEKLMFIIMGLNHLREWIAPGYDYKNPASSPQEHFFNDIYKLAEYKKINKLCNYSKHLCCYNGLISMAANVSIDEWADIDSVTNIDVGPPLGYVVDGHDIRDVIEKVVCFYDTGWFSQQQSPRT